MATPLRLLMLEDNPSDAESVLHALRRAGYDPIAVRVETEQDYWAHLQSSPELILADFTMPEFDALRALEIMQECQLDIPFIIVSGTIGEERAVEVMQRGVSDYIMKDRLGRLGQAVAHALEKNRTRNATRLAERHLMTQHAVTQALAESPTLATATSKILRAICQSLAWDFVGLWQVDERENVLRCVDCWHNPLAEVADFEAISRQSTFAPGIGVPGRIWVSGQAAWVADVAQDLSLPRGPCAASVGLHGAFGFPIILGTDTLGILEFFSREIKQPDDETLKMMMAIGSQLGQYIERKRAEEALRASESRFRLLLESSAGGTYGIDMNGRCTFINKAGARTLGYEADELLGKNMHDLLHHHHADGRPYDVQQCPIFRAFRTGQTCHVDTEVFWGKKGTLLAQRQRASPNGVEN